jgi:hypothetical protein
MQSFPSDFEGRGDVVFDRVAIIEKGQSQLIHSAKRSLQFPDTVFAATAFDEIVMVETLTVTCRMISNWLHTFRFERESGTKDFVLAEHL